MNSSVCWSLLKRHRQGMNQFFHIGYLRTSSVLSNVVAFTFDLFISCGRSRNNWSIPNITPAPKVTPPKCLSDVRPISVTPILSRLCKRYVVKQYLLPAIPSVDIDDQFAFRHTGSTTAALIYILHQVTLLLETNNYVRCLLVDFS